VTEVEALRAEIDELRFVVEGSADAEELDQFARVMAEFAITVTGHLLRLDEALRALTDDGATSPFAANERAAEILGPPLAG
jgi:hypothetical protein